MSISDFDAFHFQSRLRLPVHHRIASTESTFDLPGLGEHDRMLIRSESGAPLNDSMALMLSGHGYGSLDDARAAALCARSTFSIAALECGVGVEWQESSDIWKGIRAHIGIQGTCVGTFVGGVGAERFRDRFAEWMMRGVELSPEQKRCAELLADFHFDMSGRSRFLLAYAAIEELAPRPLEDADYRDALAALGTYLNAVSLDADVKARLSRRLAGLEKVSDTNRCKRFVKELLGPEALRDFSKLTRERGDIAHRGEADEMHGSFQLHLIARDLLFKSISLQAAREESC